MSYPIKISIIIPIYNEEGNIAPLIKNTSKSCENISHEILAVDDGSNDGSRAELQKLKAEFSNLKLIFLKRNFGQTAALAAGIDQAKGEIIIPMDGDGQNDPDDIPRLLELIDKGFDVVSGWRKERHDSFINRRLPSMMANGLISWVTGVHLHDYGCTLKAYRRNVIETIQIAGEMHRFLPAWCVWQGGKVTEIPVQHHPRTIGKSKYGIFRIVKVIIDLMTLKFFSGYLFKPNYLFSGSGLVCFFASALSAAIAFIDKFGPNAIAHLRYPLLLLAVFFALVGIMLVLMGLLAELMVRLYFEVRKQKPYRLTDE